MIYVTDTHSLVFRTSDREARLGKLVAKFFKRSNRKNIPSSSLSSCSKKPLFQKKVVRLAVPLRRWAEELDRSANFPVQPHTIEILFDAISLVDLRDAADRAIVATARHLRCPSIAAVEIIQDESWIETVCDWTCSERVSHL